MIADIEFVNLTPHAIVVRGDTWDTVFKPSGTVPRVAVTQATIGTVRNIPITKTVYGDVTGMPPKVFRRMYIVSALVLNALAGSRNDVVAPDTSPSGAIRDEEGRIIAVKGFVC